MAAELQSELTTLIELYKADAMSGLGDVVFYKDGIQQPTPLPSGEMAWAHAQRMESVAACYTENPSQAVLERVSSDLLQVIHHAGPSGRAAITARLVRAKLAVTVGDVTTVSPQCNLIM